MKSTNTLEITTSKIFEIIKNFYSKNFPYPTKFNAIDAINLSFSDGTYNRCVKGQLEIKDNNIPVYVGMHNEYTPVFKNENLCLNFVQDVDALQSWLVKNEFIVGDVATEKLIQTKSLHF